MKRFLPPLVVAVLLGLVAWRVAQDPRRDRGRALLRAQAGAAAANPDRMAEFVAHTQTHLDRYGADPEERWFVARVLLEAGMDPAAVRTIWADTELRSAPGTARRLGDLLLRHAGWRDHERLLNPLAPANVVAPILADGGAQDALSYCEDVVAREPWLTWPNLYYSAWVFGGPEVQRSLVAGLRAKGQHDADVAAALVALGPAPYEEREQDLALLREVVEGAWRREQRISWSLACVALGRSGEVEALALLERLAESLAASETPMDREDAAMASIGLVAGGRWDAEARLAPFLPFQSPPRVLLDWYIHAVVHRWRQGDEAALDRIRTWWDRGPPGGILSARPRLVVALYQRVDEPLPARDGPLAFIEEDLARADLPPPVGVLGVMIALRRGESGAADRLLQYIQDVSQQVKPAQDDGFGDPLLYSPLLLATRALYLYGDSSDH